MSSPDTAADDVSMDDEEKKADKAAPPDPPLAPIIETPDQEEDATMNMGEPSVGTVERIEEAQETEDLAAGLSEGQPSKPVILKPRPPTPPPIMKAHAKPKPKEGAVPKDFTPGNQPVMPKMTTQVRQVPKKSEPTTESKSSETVVEPKSSEAATKSASKSKAERNGSCSRSRSQGKHSSRTPKSGSRRANGQR